MRSATAKNSAMAIEAGLIWRAIFVFIGIRFTFSFGKFFSVLQNFSKSELLQWITRGHGISRKRKHLSRLSALPRALIMAAKNERRAALKSSLGTARSVRESLSKIHSAGLIQITADFGSASVYPAPGSRVTTTLYA